MVVRVVMVVVVPGLVAVVMRVAWGVVSLSSDQMVAGAAGWPARLMGGLIGVAVSVLMIVTWVVVAPLVSVSVVNSRARLWRGSGSNTREPNVPVTGMGVTALAVPLSMTTTEVVAGLVGVDAALMIT